MLKRTKTKLTIISVATVALASAVSVIFFMKKDEMNPRITFKDIDQAPVQASILPLRNHDVIYVKCIFESAGVLHDKIEKHGISNVVASILLRRINNMSIEETAERFIELGIRDLSINSSKDDFEISFFIPKEKAREAFKFINNAFVHPTFSDGDLESIKERIPTVLDPETASPYQLIKQKMLEMLYVDCNYGLNTAGSSQAIASITAEDVQKFIKEKLTRKNLKILFAGDMNNLDARQYLQTLLNDISDGEANEVMFVPSKTSSQKSAHIIKKNMRDIVGIVHGIRLDQLSDIEKAALIIISNAIFDDKNSDFDKGLNEARIACKFHTQYLERSFSDAFLLFAYVNKKDSDNYMKYFDAKISEYNSGRIFEKLKSIQEYLIKIANNGFYNLSDIDEQMKNAYLPFDKVTEEDLSKVMKMVFNKTVIKTVTCSSKER